MPLERRFFDSTNDVPGAIHEDGQLLLLQRKQFKINKVYFGGARVCFDYAIKFAQLDALSRYADAIGLMFQIVDDLLDVTQTTSHLGKTAGKDAEQGKLTFPGLLGVDASKEEVEEATRLAHLDSFIAQLPQGYETLVGERGLKVSGGEKQRIAIARMLLKKPGIMIFDEATSSLDSNSEQNILEALREVAQSNTTLVIAHRLSTIIDADNIVVLDQGRVVEQGTHASLLSQGGVYAKLWEMQQREARQTEAPAEVLSSV